MTEWDAGHRQFGEFLRARREELAPESVGLPSVGRPRRVSGLRREEVAQLASISTDYYTRLEQARLPAPSETVLSALIHALRLNDDQERYLRTLANRHGPRPTARSGPQTAHPDMLTLLENMGVLPAMVLGRHMDVLAWNASAAALFTDFAVLERTERNIVRLVFLDPEVRSRFKSWPSAARTAAALLRIASAQYPDDARLRKVVGELSSSDPDFRTWWSSQRVVSSSHGLRTYVHPSIGEIELIWQMLTSSAYPDHTLIVLSPPAGGRHFSEKIARLLQLGSAPVTSGTPAHQS